MAMVSVSGHQPLHSTMFLLILVISRRYQIMRNFTFHYVSINTSPSALSFDFIWPLHSTMFLLIRCLVMLWMQCRKHFTFHYVSINTEQLPVKSISYPSLHSTMFLLIPLSSEPPINSSILYHILSTMIFFYLFIYFDITRFTGSTILLMFFTFVDLS